jgi:hypothetical protein
MLSENYSKEYIPSENYSREYEASFKKIDHYKKYWQMMPWIGAEYNRNRFLIIGESHYLDKTSTVHSSPEKWYDYRHTELLQNDLESTFTAKIIDNAKDHGIFRNISQAIKCAGFKKEETENIFRYFAFYNYFQRPGNLATSIQNKNQDDEISFTVFIKIIEIIKPKFIAFVSIKAYKSYKNMNKERGFPINESNIKIDFFPHPTCQWWNNKADPYRMDGIEGKLTGKEKFIEFVKRCELT